MNKKITLISILAVILLAAISFSSAVSSNSTTMNGKESPLFRIRTKMALGERFENLKGTLKARFIRDRIFFLPFQWFLNNEKPSLRQQLGDKSFFSFNTCCDVFTCVGCGCTRCTQCYLFN